MSNNIKEALSQYQKKRNKQTPTNVYLIVENPQDKTIDHINIWTSKRDLSKEDKQSLDELADLLGRLIMIHSK